MVSLDDAVVARMSHSGHHFEVLVDPKVAFDYRSSRGKTAFPDEALVIDKIFKDARKGEELSEEFIKTSFGTTDVVAVAKQIVLRGEIQLTTDQRRELVEKKRRAVVDYIARNAVDPKTGSPHPVKRVELAMEEIRVHIDPSKSVDELVKEIVAALRPLLPLKFESVKVHVHLPAKHAGPAYGTVKSHGTLLREAWNNDGSWDGVVEMPAGEQASFFDALNKRTHGEAETRVERGS